MTRLTWRDLLRLPRSGPTTLAAVRIIIAAQALWILLSRDVAGISTSPSFIWEGRSPEWQFRFLLVPGVPGIESALWALAVFSLGCVLVGYRTRIFGVVAGLLLYHLAPEQALMSFAGPWGKGLTIATLSLPILACSPCEDRWSVAASLQPAPIRNVQAYGWAVMMVRLLFAQIYLWTAIARVWSGGLQFKFDWANMESVRNHIMVFVLAHPILDTPLNAWLVSKPALCAALALGTLLFEFSFITAVFVPVIRIPLALAGVMFHTGLWLTLGFRYPNLAHFLLFIDFAGEAKATPTAKNAAEGDIPRAVVVGG